MYHLMASSHFDAAHRIEDYQGKCSREHGHRWGVTVELQGNELDDMNILIDFSLVKARLKEIIDTHLDHYQLNDTLAESNVTAEFLAKWLYENLSDYDLGGVELMSVTISESPDCSVRYSE